MVFDSESSSTDGIVIDIKGAQRNFEKMSAAKGENHFLELIDWIMRAWN